MSKRQARNYVFTWNNYPDDFLVHFQRSIKDSVCSYIIYGKELGEEKTPHLQGYAEFTSARTLAGLKKLFPKEIHWEPRRGTQKQAIAYCKKDGDFVELGSQKKQGKRNDITEMLEVSAFCNDFSEACFECPTIFRYPRSHQRLVESLLEKEAPKWRNVKCWVYWGATGTGKTRSAVDHDSFYLLDCSNSHNLWFNGYNRESRLVIDDFYGWIKFGTLLRLLDGYKMRLEVKGGFTYAFWNEVIITSNREYTEWYKNLSGPQMAALERRLKTGGIKFFDDDDNKDDL